MISNLSKVKAEKKYFLKDGTLTIWWKPSFRREWIEYVNERLRIADCRKGHIVLEIGGGDGRFGLPLLSNGCIYIDVDLSKEIIHILQQKVKKENLSAFCDLVLADGTNLPFVEGKFDRAICYATILHIPTQEDVVREMGRVTKRNGFFVIEFHNICHVEILFKLIKHRFTKIVRNLLKKEWLIVPYYPVTPPRAISYFKKTATKVVDVKGYFIFFGSILQKYANSTFSRLFMYQLKNTFLKWFGSAILIKAQSIEKGSAC